MYRNVAKGLALTLMLVIAVPYIAIAQEDTPVTTQSTETQTQNSEDVTAESRETQREERIKALKEKKETILTNVEQRKITAKCKSAQVIVDNLQSRLNKVVEDRRAKYTNLSSNLTELSAKLKVAGADTTALDEVITDVEATITNTVETLDSYQTSLADLSAMDCEADPTGFKALLDDSRTQRTEILALQGTLKSTINETVKPVLQTIRETIQAGTTNGEDEDQ